FADGLASHSRSRQGVEVFASPVCLGHALLVGQGCGHTQLDLRVVGDQQLPARGSRHHGTDHTVPWNLVQAHAHTIVPGPHLDVGAGEPPRHRAGDVVGTAQSAVVVDLQLPGSQ